MLSCPVDNGVALRLIESRGMPHVYSCGVGILTERLGGGGTGV